MRLKARLDDNHGDIVKALRAVGCTVQSLAAVGKGCPDVLVGYRGVNYVLEIKDGAKIPSRRKLTDDEKEWHADWRGKVFIVESVQEALLIVGSL